ncbi:hypothetical protein ACN38_g3730 [Penicillium nordicum]|uniref:Uncharacterized protein n=1 Tax=Penicillium nordicum TaxID=229535 RepID=A0A0M9WHR1_9EURO|nr:hypothetical protein ACN38_g3730 [Penicillium nordicum]
MKKWEAGEGEGNYYSPSLSLQLILRRVLSFGENWILGEKGGTKLTWYLCFRCSVLYITHITMMCSRQDPFSLWRSLI